MKKSAVRELFYILSTVAIWTSILFLTGLLSSCGTANSNPYPGAISLPEGATLICQPNNAEQQALLSSPDFNNTGRAKLTKFAGAVYCTNGTVFFTADRYTEPAPIAAGSHSTAETGLGCSFDVDTSCHVTNQIFPAGYFQ